jgi:hypothetical protein
MHRSPPPALARTLAPAVVCVLVLAGCFRLVEHKTYAIGFETNRANLVIHTTPTQVLHQVGRRAGQHEARKLILAATPATLTISTRQRLLLCTVSTGLCLTAPQVGRLLVSWFRSDITRRSDFWEALSQAGRRQRCFAWTAVPSRNLTHKGIGTSGCAPGGLP